MELLKKPATAKTYNGSLKEADVCECVALLIIASEKRNFCENCYDLELHTQMCIMTRNYARGPRLFDQYKYATRLHSVSITVITRSSAT